jgi:hypothetical protein
MKTRQEIYALTKFNIEKHLVKNNSISVPEIVSLAVLNQGARTNERERLNSPAARKPRKIVAG